MFEQNEARTSIGFRGQLGAFIVKPTIVLRYKYGTDVKNIAL